LLFACASYLVGAVVLVPYMRRCLRPL
jgi:hypothetical protein